jgi:glucokinase
MTPSTSLSAVPTGNWCAVGLDVGGTKIAGGLVRFPSGAIHVRRVLDTLPARGGAAVWEDVERLAGELAHAASTLQEPLAGVGIGVCELVDRQGRVASAHSFDWRPPTFAESLSARLGVPVRFEADVRAAALGEARFGAGRPYQNFLYVTIGTGISSCLVLDQQPYLGSRGLAGTMASSPLPGLASPAGVAGPSLEQLASGPALVARFRARGGQARSGQDVLAAAAAGNASAVEVRAGAAEALGAGLGWACNVLDPEALVLGGGLGLAGGIFWDLLVASTRRHVWSELNRHLPILPAGLGPDAGIVGAATRAPAETVAAAPAGASSQPPAPPDGSLI